VVWRSAGAMFVTGETRMSCLVATPVRAAPPEGFSKRVRPWARCRRRTRR